MTAPAATDDPAMATAIGEVLHAAGFTGTVDRLVPIFGGNARRAIAFDLVSDGMVRPCILLSQVAATHVESHVDTEFSALRALGGSAVPAPAALALDTDGRITGAPAIILERVSGNASATDFLGKTETDTARGLTADLARAAAALHSLDWRSRGLATDSADPARAQIHVWEQIYLQRRLEPLPILRFLFDWLQHNLPEPTRLSLVHGDLRPGNFLFDANRITALLDWEMAHIGDAAEDIAWVYRTLWSPARFMPLQDFLAIYEAAAGWRVPRRTLLYYRIFSEVKFATLSAAAAHSFASGRTQNLRHIDRASKIAACVRQALTWIDHHDAEDDRAAA